MSDSDNGQTGVASPNPDGPGNAAWQRTKYLMAQMQGRNN